MRRLFATVGVLATFWGAGQASDVGSATLRDSRIVILSGLPGDAESDRDYQRQLGAMLDLLSAAGVRPDAAHVLVNDPSEFAPPAAWKGVDVQAATRSNFLALGEALGASPQPVVAIVWGHGGMVRDAPVLHVAGPRIARDDFGAFAREAEKSGAPTRWVLFFPGSGAVAQALADKKREILASENEVRFTSDPLGLDIFLASWKRRPAATLDEIARESGPQIAKWYADRGQARTEEPSWFSSGMPPVLLADLPAPQAPPAVSADRKLPEGWKEIHLVRAADYPDRDAIVLSREARYALGENPAIAAEIEEYTQILTPEGKSVGDFDLDFSPPDEDLEFLALEVLGPDGQLEVLDPEKVHDAERGSLPGYEPRQRKVFSLPGVEAGAILHVKYRRVWKRFPFPYVFLELPIAEEMPVLRSTLRVETLHAQALHHAIADADAQAPRETSTKYGRIYEWAWSDLPATHQELLDGSGLEPRVLLSTFPDWKAFAGWYGRLIREADAMTDELRAKSAALTAGLKTPREKTKAIYEYVTRLRYVSIPLGVNSFRPHAAANVLRSQYGDCKDKANLLNTLLRAAGIEAHLVLVPRFGQTNAAVPGLAFNHAISRVELPGGPLWLDSTDDVCPFGMLPPGDPGRDVLVIDGQSVKLERLPDPDPGAHALEIGIEIDAAGRGNLRLSGHGYAGYRMREAARHADVYRGTVSVLTANELAPAGGTFVSTKSSHSPVSALDGAFDWKASGDWSGLAVKIPVGLLTVAPFMLPTEWARATQPRTRPLLLNDGFPVALHETLRLPLPAGDSVFPPPVGKSDGPFRWSLSWRREKDVGVGELRISIPRTSLDPAESARLQTEFRRLREALAVPVFTAAKE